MLETLGLLSLIAIIVALIVKGVQWIVHQDEEVLTKCAIALCAIFLIVAIIFFIAVAAIKCKSADKAKTHEWEWVVTMYSKDGQPACSWNTYEQVDESEDGIHFTDADGLEVTIKDAPVVVRKLQAGE